MNAKAREIDMTQSHFGSPNGWPDEGRTFVTARDLTTLASAMIRKHPDLYARYFGHRTLTYRGIAQRNHDAFTGQVRGGDGIKTGFTNEAGYGFVGSAKRGERRLVLVVAGAERARVRDQAARSYLEWGFTAFDSRPLFARGQVVDTARVQNGQSRSVPLLTGSFLAAAIPKGQQRAIRLSVHYDGPLRAPVTKGQQVAELEIAVEGMEPSRVPLFAGVDVPEAGAFSRLINGVMGWFG
jgi:D-alanyl-D-alanine carboxypeptidase (penicillin-binding protein 5/6)